MKLENQVVSLELAKKLKELGVKQESLFYWHFYKGKESEASICQSFGMSHGVFQSAYTVAELGEMLPRNIDYQCSTEEHSGHDGYRSMNFQSGMTIIDSGWYCMYSDPHPANKVPIYSAHAKTEADARAKMLIYLLENDLLTPPNN